MKSGALRIEKLTPEQVARFPEFVERWTRLGLCTNSADRPQAESAIYKVYEAVNLERPRKIVWCGSPLSQGLTRAIILDRKLLKNVWASVGASVGDSVRASVGDSVRASVWDSVRAPVGDSVRASVWDSVGDSVYGQHDAGWLAFYAYFNEVAGLNQQTEKLSGLWLLCKSSGWALPHQKICWISERHHILIRDERGRLHSLAGPACAYPDGWAIYAIHGVRVPRYVVEHPQEITVEKIKVESNVEVRRVMIERYGEDRYITDSGMKAVSHDENFGTLYFENLNAGRPICKVRVVNRSPEPDGTFKAYWLPVNPTHYNRDAGRIPQAAVASTWRTEPGGKVLLYKDYRDYQPVVET